MRFIKNSTLLIGFCWVATTLGASGISLAAESPLKVGGFVDAQTQFTSEPTMTRNFTINDGAIYLSKDSDIVDFRVDLPFRLINSGSTNFEFATIRAQAYAGYKYANGLRWKLGQFDTTYGFDVNDTVDTVFTRQGNVYNFTDPFVHAGLQVGYDLNKALGFNFLVGAPNDTGTLRKNVNPQFGAQVVYLGDMRFTLGGLMGKSAATDKFNYYVDATAGMTMGQLNLDAEVNYQKRQGEVTPLGDELPGGVGALLQGVFAFNETVSAGVRGEYITKISQHDPRTLTTLTYLDKQFLVFVGPQFALTKDFKLKVDYSFQSDTAYGDTNAVKVHAAQAAAVYRF